MGQDPELLLPSRRHRQGRRHDPKEKKRATFMERMDLCYLYTHQGILKTLSSTLNLVAKRTFLCALDTISMFYHSVTTNRPSSQAAESGICLAQSCQERRMEIIQF
jgi:hypothetical protein